MGMTYKIDRACRVVRTRGWGVVSTAELQELTSRILLDPQFDPTYRSLADLSEVTDVKVDTMALAQTAALPPYDTGTRRAIVATGDAVFGMARMFATFSERAGHEVRVFRELPLAEEWLEL